MNFKQTIMCIGLLVFTMQFATGASLNLADAAAKEVGLQLANTIEPTIFNWYVYTMLHSYLAAHDAACIVPGFATDLAKKVHEHWIGYIFKHPIATVSAAVTSYLLWKYFPFDKVRKRN